MLKKEKTALLVLLTTILMVTGVNVFDKKHEPTGKPVKKEAVKPALKPVELKYENDTVYINSNYYKNVICSGRAPGGLYIPKTNTIRITVYMPGVHDYRIEAYCARARNNILLIKRHETEHARKAAIVQEGKMRSNFTSARTGIMNEIMAPASEIIEAIDYHSMTGQAFITRRPYIQEADSVIMDIMKKYNMTGPVDFSFPPIADRVLDYAQKIFFHQVKTTGIYRGKIKECYNKERMIDFRPNTECYDFNGWNFHPEWDIWDQLFTFKSTTGNHNIYRNATPETRKKLINSADSLVCDVMKIDERRLFLEKAKLR